MRSARIVSALVVVSALVALPQAGEAQGTTLAFVYQLEVDGQNKPAFEAAWKEHLAFRKANGDPWVWNTFEQIFGEEVGMYAIRSDGHAWADLDSYFAGEFNALTQAHLGATVAPLVESFTSGVVQLNVELSHPAENLNAMNVFPVSNFTLKASEQQAFMGALGTFKEAVVAAGDPTRYSVSLPIAGQPGPSVTLVVHSPNFAGLEVDEAMQNQMLIDQLGEDGAQELFEQFSSAIVSVETSVFVRRPELSSGN